MAGRRGQVDRDRGGLRRPRRRGRAGAHAALPPGWWLPGSVLVVGFATASIYLGPVVLDPIFNSSRPCPRDARGADVLTLAREAKVDVGQVYEVDASRRTTASNAYVTGLGGPSASSSTTTS